MTKHTPDRDLRFEADFSAARFNDGVTVKFTRLERRALAFFNQTAGRIVTRSQILDAVSEPGSEKSDRSIDFLINRIRGKLGDVAHAPRFIGTQYGEGYVWLYSTRQVVADYSNFFAVVGPLLGVDSLGGAQVAATEFARILLAHLRATLPPDRQVALAPELSAEQRTSGPMLTIQLGFFRDQSGAECVATVRCGKGDRIIELQRFALAEGPGQFADLSAQSQRVARRAIAAYWRDAIAGAAIAKPLTVAINDDSLQQTRNWSWSEADSRLRLMRAERPDDPAIKLMWCAHLHAKYVKHGIKLFKMGTATCAEDEAEIEHLVLESLDFAQGRPEYAVVAAKLLYFVDQGYRDLALDLAWQAQRADTSLTSTLAILGQLLGFTGDMAAAETYLRQAVELTDYKSSEQVYAYYMLIQAYMAAGDREKQAAAVQQLYRMHPALMAVFDLYFVDPDRPSLRARAMALMTNRVQATAMLRNFAYLSARLYGDPSHRENVLLGPANLFVKRFGPKVVPEEAARHLPGLIRA
ncbi:MAG: helix-turn-helix domain-containing protein [Paracoccaceae bacterium]